MGTIVEQIPKYGSILIFFSPTFTESFIELDAILKQIIKLKKLKYINDIPFILVATKSDLYEENRKVSKSDIEQLLRRYKIPDTSYIETSSKDGINIQETILEIIMQTRLNYQSNK